MANGEHNSERPASAGKRLTRRSMLGGTAVALGLGATALSTTRALAKTSQQDAKYQEKPNGGAKCAGCQLFQPPNACQLVDGNISPDGWCQFYSAKAG